MLLCSIKNSIPQYKLLCFINYELNFTRFEKFNVEFRKYYNDKSLDETYQDCWRNMSFNN